MKIYAADKSEHVDYVVMPALERSMETTTFRLGDPTEWLSVFSSAQRQRASAMIPGALRSRFGWIDQ